MPNNLLCRRSALSGNKSIIYHIKTTEGEDFGACYVASYLRRPGIRTNLVCHFPVSQLSQ